MKENLQIPSKEPKTEQAYIRLIRYLRKQQEANANETSHSKQVDSHQPK